MSIDSDRVQQFIDAALRQPGARERATGIVKFQCPACRDDGHDEHHDNAGLFTLDGTWGCAFAKDTPDGRRHWSAIGEVLGAFTRRAEPSASRNGHDERHDTPSDTTPASTIEVVDAADLIGREFPEEVPLVGGGLIVPRSLNVSGGAPKVGKSILELNREIRRAQGQPFLGFSTQPGRTLLIQAEIPELAFKQRFVRLLGAAGPEGGPIDAESIRGRILTVTRRGLFIDEPDGYDAVRRLIDETQPDLLSLDPLARFMTGDENSARDMGRLINGLDRLIQAYKIAVELVHHTGKPAAGDPRRGGHRLRGSSALFGAADSVILLDRTQDAWTLTFELRHAEEPPAMALTRTSALWFQPAGPPEKLVAVAALVKDLPLRFTAFVGAIKGDMKVSEATAERLIRDAKKAALVWQDDNGRYRQSIKRHQSNGDDNGSRE